MSVSAIPTPRRALFVCLFAAATALLSAALVCAAVLVPAPAAALPVIVAAAIGLPMAVASELPTAIAVLRMTRGAELRRRHVSELRRALQRLPETRHPLDL
jgi:hypothetical protein